MATQAGGSFHYAPTAQDMTEVYNVIGREVRSRYVLRYSTHNTNFDGTLRSVTVAANGQNGTGVYRVNYTPLNFALPGQAVAVTADIADSDPQDGISQALAYYRVHNEQQTTPYYSATLQQGNSNTYTGVIPADQVTEAGVDYYISAWDLHGVRADHGTTVRPHFVLAAGCRLTGTPTLAEAGHYSVVLGVSDGSRT